MTEIQTLSLAFIALVIGAQLLRSWLDQRQIASIDRNRNRVPSPFDNRITPEEHEKAAAYNLAQLRFGRIEGVYATLLTLAWTLGGGIEWLDQWWRQQLDAPLWLGLALILSFTMLTTLLELPFSIWRTFRIEAAFGFNRTTPRLFVADLLRSAVVSLLIGTPLLLLVLWFMESNPTSWWLLAWIAWATFSLAMMWLWPNWIAPIFNRFEPLPEGPLKVRIEQLLERCGFNSGGLYVMDGSRRSTHGNAYFSGFGRQKRIVFYDTLIDRLEEKQIEAVLAHELGHFRLRHITSRIALLFLLSLLALALLGWLANQPLFYHALGISTVSHHAALLLFAILLPQFGLLFQPLTNQISRRHEFEADRFAADQSSASDLIDALLGLYRDNASTLTPDPIYATFHYSHPPASERIDALTRLTRQPAKSG